MKKKTQTLVLCMEDKEEHRKTTSKWMSSEVDSVSLLGCGRSSVEPSGYVAKSFNA
jgi:hypothetical protein